MGLGQLRIELNGLGGVLNSVDILLLLDVGLSSTGVKFCIFRLYSDCLSSHKHRFQLPDQKEACALNVSGSRLCLAALWQALSRKTTRQQ